MPGISLNNTIHLNEASFERAITGRTAIIDFWAPWCGPCKTLGPIIDSLAKATGDAVLVGKINVDDNQNLAGTYNVSSIPCVIKFVNGREVDRKVGVMGLDALQAWANG